MIDKDNILEAEQNIQKISSELSKIQSAANLLQNAQSQVDSVLKSSSKVIDAAGTFTQKAGQIISELDATNLNKKIDDLSNNNLQLINQLSVHSSQLTEIDTKLSNNASHLDDHSSKLIDLHTKSDDLSSQHQMVLDQLSSLTSQLSQHSTRIDELHSQLTYTFKAQENKFSKLEVNTVKFQKLTKSRNVWFLALLILVGVTSLASVILLILMAFNII